MSSDNFYSSAQNWGNLRGLCHETSYPSFVRLWTCIMRFDAGERAAASDYVQRSVTQIAGGLSDQLSFFKPDVLEPWIQHVVCWKLWQSVDSFEDHPELLERVLADLYLREHAYDKDFDALEARRQELREDRAYYAVGAHGEWLHSIAQALMEKESWRCAHDIHHQIAQWNAMPEAQGIVSEEVREGFSRARETWGEQSGLPGLLGGGIGQLLGAGVETLRHASASISRMNQGLKQSREQALSEVEDHMVEYCLRWAS